MHAPDQHRAGRDGPLKVLPSGRYCLRPRGGSVSETYLFVVPTFCPGQVEIYWSEIEEDNLIGIWKKGRWLYGQPTVYLHGLTYDVELNGACNQLYGVRLVEYPLEERAPSRHCRTSGRSVLTYSVKHFHATHSLSSPCTPMCDAAPCDSPCAATPCAAPSPISYQHGGGDGGDGDGNYGDGGGGGSGGGSGGGGDAIMLGNWSIQIDEDGHLVIQKDQTPLVRINNNGIMNVKSVSCGEL